MRGAEGLTGYLPDAHEAADEAGIGEEQLKHFGGANVEDSVEEKPALLLRRACALLH